MVFFSTIIPVFNRVDLVAKTLESVFKQDFVDHEIIIIDDGSTDGTYEVLEKYTNRIKLFYQENKGPGEARNLGIHHAKGKYVVFIDSDDLSFPWTLSTFEKAIKTYKFPSFIAGRAIYFQNASDLPEIKFQSFNAECFSDFYASANRDLPFLTSTVAVKRTTIQEVGGFTTQRINGEDNDLWLKLGTARNFVYIHAPLVLAYRQHENSAVADITKTYQGACYLIQQEQEGLYPGGQERLISRLVILTRHIIPVSLACLDRKQLSRAFCLYRYTFNWNLKLRRFRYLAAFILLLIVAFAKKSVNSFFLTKNTLH